MTAPTETNPFTRALSLRIFVAFLEIIPLTASFARLAGFIFTRRSFQLIHRFEIIHVLPLPADGYEAPVVLNDYAEIPCLPGYVF